MAEQYTEIISGEGSVITALQSLIDGRVVCTMEIPRTKHSWITLLLEITRIHESPYLLIDRVAGFESIFSHSPETEVSLEYMDSGGVPCRFNCKVIACRPGDILSELPQAIYRSQKRQYFRIEALLGAEIAFRKAPSEKVEKTRVKDYSAGGVAFIMEGNLDFGIGDPLYDIRLNIPEGTEWFNFHVPQAVVRRIELHSYYAGGKTLCAIEFMEISNETRRCIISHILRQQRILIKRIRR